MTYPESMGLEKYIDNTLTPALPHERFSMYDLPDGIASLVEEDITRYKETKEALIQQIPSIVKTALQDTNPSVREIAARMIATAPEGERAELIAHIKVEEGANLQDIALKTALYTNAQDRFVRKNFPKTGSTITLFDRVPGSPEKTLRNKVIARDVSFSAYATLAQIFEAHDFWKEKGFDYVPIEPIIRVRSNKKKPVYVTVFTKVLGPSVSEWESKTPLFRMHIEREMTYIREALKEFGIEHGHTHTGNFCLMFHRKEDGEADLTKPPRVYMIDFDQARSVP